MATNEKLDLVRNLVGQRFGNLLVVGIVVRREHGKIKKSILVRCKGCSKHKFEYSGIDRVDSSVGYSMNNCIPCCKVCNWSKTNQSVGEFLAWAQRVAERNAGFDSFIASVV